jgi:hypothetical protein
MLEASTPRRWAGRSTSGAMPASAARPYSGRRKNAQAYEIQRLMSGGGLSALLRQRFDEDRGVGKQGRFLLQFPEGSNAAI